MNFDELAAIGRIDGMPAADYHAIDACSSSALRGCLSNPAKYRHKALTGLSGDSIDFGSAVHAIACGKFAEECAAWDGRRDERQEKYRDFLAANAGKTILKPQQEVDAQVAWAILQEAVAQTPEADHILTGDQEVSLFWWEDVVLGDGSQHRIPCKARADVLNADRRYLTDLKTAKDASAYGFSKAAKTWRHLPGYDVQAAWYMRGCERVIDERARWSFYFAVVENSAPWCAACYVIDENYLIDTVYDLMMLGLKTWAECWTTKVWPGYDRQLNWIA